MDRRRLLRRPTQPLDARRRRARQPAGMLHDSAAKRIEAVATAPGSDMPAGYGGFQFRREFDASSKFDSTSDHTLGLAIDYDPRDMARIGSHGAGEGEGEIDTPYNAALRGTQSVSSCCPAPAARQPDRGRTAPRRYAGRADLLSRIATGTRRRRPTS